MGQEYLQKGCLNPFTVFDACMLQTKYARLTVSRPKQMNNKIVKAGYKDFNLPVGRDDRNYFLKCPPRGGEHFRYMPVSGDTFRFIRHDHVEYNNAQRFRVPEMVRKETVDV